MKELSRNIIYNDELDFEKTYFQHTNKKPIYIYIKEDDNKSFTQRYFVKKFNEIKEIYVIWEEPHFYNDKLYICYCYQYDDVPGFRDRDWSLTFWTTNKEEYDERRKYYRDSREPFCNGYSEYTYYDMKIGINKKAFDQLSEYEKEEFVYRYWSK